MNKTKEYKQHIIIFLVLLFGFILVSPFSVSGDEFTHIPQIWLFIHKHFFITDYLTIIPGYHLLMAAILGPAGIATPKVLRVINLGISIGVIIVYFQLLKKRKNEETATLRTLQLLTYPFFAAYAILAYTEPLNNLLLLFLFAILQEHKSKLLANIIILLVFVTRQMTITAVVASVLLLNETLLTKTNFKKCIKENYTYFFTSGACIVLLLLLNKGNFAVGAKEHYPFPHFDFANVLFFFFSYFLLFLPINIVELVKVKVTPKNTLIFSSIFAISTILFFELSSFLNHYNWVAIGFNMRNTVIMYIRTYTSWAIMFNVLVSLGVVCFYKYLGNYKRFFIFFFILILSLSQIWIVSIRYYLTTIILFNLYRKDSAKVSSERIQVALNAIIAIVFIGLNLMTNFDFL